VDAEHVAADGEAGHSAQAYVADAGATLAAASRAASRVRRPVANIDSRRFGVVEQPVKQRLTARKLSLAGIFLAAAAALVVFALPSGAAPARVSAERRPPARAFTVKPSSGLRAGRTVEYWIGAVPTTWNVVPSGTDPMLGTTFDPAKTTMQTAIYRRFTADFKNQLPPAGYGLVGPVVQAQVGDTIVIHFKNFDPNNPHSMHFHGVHYDSDSDGAYIPNVSGPGADVKPGQTFTYRMEAGADSAGVWPYHDHSPSMDTSIRGGLYGALSIRAKGQKKPDREFVVFFEKQLNFNTIDGLAFINNTPTFRAKVGDVVQWDVLGLGDDHHSFHVHGHRWSTADGTRDVQTVSPAESFVFRWKEDRPGTWLYHCHVEEHMMNGMIGLYVVTK
jgi:FtsP/CotA-like multicopper oxidase with cupredoxin domain